MSGFTRKLRGRKPVKCGLSRAFCAVAMLTYPVLGHAADDPYLRMLDEEVTKVEGVSTDTAGDKAGKSQAAGGKGTESRALPSREHFEGLLRRQNVGTYSFYRRLPERSREEIFVDYSNGASMEALRGKIIDRYLHP